MSKQIALFSGVIAGAAGDCRYGADLDKLSQALPRSQWAQAAWSPDINVIEQMVHYSLLPRLAISLLVGAGLGLVGVLFQQVLRNPLAEPTTLGVATGAQLGITVTTLWAIPRCYGEPVCRAGGRLCRWLNRLWRRVGETAFAGYAYSRGAGGEPLLRGN